MPPGSELLGALTLSNVRRGVAQAGTLGYWIGAPYAASGLHDVGRAAAAADWPSSTWRCTGWKPPACRTTRPRLPCCSRCGFEHEGLARAYLKIAGEWRDHLLFAKLAS